MTVVSLKEVTLLAIVGWHCVHVCERYEAKIAEANPPARSTTFRSMQMWPRDQDESHDDQITADLKFN